ncbi:unnamed protein product [Phytomonas sp. Hart1]|nr:unnamed protein product [Phytomonas sp. Hart1]|eukprot:CCW72053.1 unnamed protein product [Phytomonas sp. isolate Hart1]
MPSEATNNQVLDNLAPVFAGGLAGLCSTCITNPLDTIRVRLSSGSSATGKSHKSLIRTTRELFEEGILHAFSRGLGANIMASMPSNAIYLPTYHFLKRKMEAYGVNTEIRPMICACGSVMVTNYTLAPLFVVRTRVQVDTKISIRAVFLDVLRRDGPRGFYRGTVTNVLGRFVEESVFWTVYELLKRITNEGTFTERNFVWASAAMLSLTVVGKLAATCVAYPYNVMMNHMRTVNKLTGKHDYVHVGPTIRHIYRSDGILGFYKGLSPQIMRNLISKAAQIYSFELLMFTYARMRAQRQSPIMADPIHIESTILVKD